MRTRVRRIGLAVGVGGVLAVLAIAAHASLGHAQGHTDGPVISLGEDLDDYPTASVSGRIRLVGDCLLLRKSVVFWPHRTTWDEDRQAVQFAGDFQGSAPVLLGEKFSGGGGFYSADNVRDMVSLDSDVVLRCMRATGADSALLVYPS